MADIAYTPIDLLCPIRSEFVDFLFCMFRHIALWYAVVICRRLCLWPPIRFLLPQLYQTRKLFNCHQLPSVILIFHRREGCQ